MDGLDELMMILSWIWPPAILIVLLKILGEVRAIRMLNRGIATVASGLAGRESAADHPEGRDPVLQDRIRRTAERSGRAEAVLRVVEELGVDAATAARVVDSVIGEERPPQRP